MASGGAGAARWLGRGALVFGFAALTATAVVAAPAVPTERTVQATGSVTQAAAAQAVPTEAADPTGCNRARRRLWVEGEGWIVRRITTCH